MHQKSFDWHLPPRKLSVVITFLRRSLWWCIKPNWKWRKLKSWMKYVSVCLCLRRGQSDAIIVVPSSEQRALEARRTENVRVAETMKRITGSFCRRLFVRARCTCEHRCCGYRLSPEDRLSAPRFVLLQFNFVSILLFIYLFANCAQLISFENWRIACLSDGAPESAKWMSSYFLTAASRTIESSIFLPKQVWPGPNVQNYSQVHSMTTRTSQHIDDFGNMQIDFNHIHNDGGCAPAHIRGPLWNWRWTLFIFVPIASTATIQWQ